MSTQLHEVLDEERAREPAIGPCAAMPLVSDAQCAAVDETSAHLPYDIGSNQGRLYDDPAPNGPLWPTFLVGVGALILTWLCWLS